MKKAVVVGGSNGIGLSITINLQRKGYHVNVLDVVSPHNLKGEYTYIPCNLLYLNTDTVKEQANDPEVEVLMITAGIGRVADFQYLHLAEINKLLTIDLVSTIDIIRLFYNRIKSKEKFYCGVIGSIAGFVSSPMFSVYAAAKAGIMRFVESVNIELEVYGTNNRILNVAPLSVKGTKFNGGTNCIDEIKELGNDIVDKLFSSDELYIPQQDLCTSIITRYQNNPHEYGLHSYQYKKDSGRANNENKVIIGYLSGTFDLFHIGHLNLLKRAKEQCDYLIVGVHTSGSWKGKETFVPFEERVAVVAACKYVDKAVPSCKEDSDAWNLWHYNRLFVGSDYKGTERFNQYEKFFADKDVEIVYFPYTKETSSTQLRQAITKRNEDK